MQEHKDILSEKIFERRKEMKPDRSDMTFGEIINMYVDNEIIISPEFQRTFRWDEERPTRFIESLLLGITILPIFVAETKDWVWKLVYGLQRLTTILSFFSKKVLDKANTIEFNKVNLSYSFEDEENSSEYDQESNQYRTYHNNFLKSEFLKIKDCREKKDIALKTIDRLIEINNILQKYDNHFGYRVRDEIVFYMIYALKYNLMTFDEAFDYCMVQKILPKISGSSSDTLEILASIFEYINDYKIPNKQYMEESELDEMSKYVFPTIGESNNPGWEIPNKLGKAEYTHTN